MPTVSSAQFLDTLRASNLLSPESLANADALFARERDARPIAVRLVNRGWITRWQAQQLLAGRDRFFLGRYKLLKQVAKQGSRVSFQAEHSVTGRVVTVRVLTRQAQDDAQEVAGFAREIETLSRLRHSNLVDLIDADTIGDLEFEVLDWFHGPALRTWLEEFGRLPIDWSCECVLQAAQGLGYAHARGLCHGALTPASVLTAAGDTRDVPRVKVADLTLATAVQRGQPQAAIHADVRGLGGVLYELLAGDRPFDVPSAATAGPRVAPEIRRRRDDVPVGLAEVVADMLSCDPAVSYPTMAAVELALEPFAMPAARPARVLHTA